MLFKTPTVAGLPNGDDMKTLFRAALAAAAVALATIGYATAAGADPVSAEGDFLGRTNRLRAENGAGALTSDQQMVDVARRWSGEMARQQQLSHNPNLKNEVDNWRVIGENVGVGSDVATIQRAFEDSPRHRENILNNTYTHAGIGVVEVDGRIWVTVVFKQPRTTSTPAAATASPPPAPRPTAPPRTRVTTPPKPRAVAAPRVPAPRVAAPAPTPTPTTAVPTPAPPVTVAAPTLEAASPAALPAAPAAAGGGAGTAGVASVVAALLLGAVVSAARRSVLAVPAST